MSKTKGENLLMLFSKSQFACKYILKTTSIFFWHVVRKNVENIITVQSIEKHVFL